MLPDRLIPYREHDGRAVPTWLGPRDEIWLREMAEEIDACIGLPVDEADARIVETSHRLAHLHGTQRRAVEAVWHVERRRHATRVDAPAPPERIREVLFDLAAERPRGEAVVTAAIELGVPAGAMLEALFADRPGARRLEASDPPPTPRLLAEQYNLALAESFLLRSSEVVATLHGHARRVVSAAQLAGLMLRAEEDETGTTRLAVSGPLALFHETIKYGRALARWLHALATTPAWRIRGEARLGGRALAFALEASDPIPLRERLSRATDSKVEARLAQALRREAPHVRVERESVVVAVGRRRAYPDFVLHLPEGRVLVEVVGFWTPAYLASKAELARQAQVPLVLCVDVRHAHGALAEGDTVVSFRKTIEVPALLRACHAALALGNAGAAVAAVPKPLRLRLRYSPTSTFARLARSRVRVPERWPEEIHADLTAGGGIRAVALATHPLYGPQILLVGTRFVVRCGRERRRGDTLFVNALWPHDPNARHAVTPRTFPAELALLPAEVEANGASAPELDDVADLFARLSPHGASV